MAYATLSVTAPTGTTYDSANPTQGTEELNMTLHAILQDMEDAGTWYLQDGVASAGDGNAQLGLIHDMIEEVFDYADGAITTYRATGTPTLAVPTATTITRPGVMIYAGVWAPILIKTYQQCMKMVYLIYYMWKTETDPLRVKDYIRDMLLAWPLQDITLDLADDGGNQIRVHPLSHLTET